MFIQLVLRSMSNQLQERIDPSKPLDNDKHEKFAFEYAITGNATKSYLQVYECEYDTAKNNGSRLLADACVRARVTFIQKAQTDSAFATLVAGFQATKPFAYDPESTLIYVPDHQARTANAMGVLKANGVINNNNTTNITNNTQYNVLGVSNATDIKDVLSMIKDMRTSTRKSPSGVIDVDVESKDL